MTTNIPNNLLHLKEIHTRTELWKDKIYHIANNPYKFPKNDGSGDFLPLPKKFAEILTEFRKEIDKQKEAERTEEERIEAQQKINEIYQQIQVFIQQEIELVESERMDFASSHQPTEEEKQALIEWEKNKEEKLQQLKLGCKKTTLSQFKRFNEEYLKSEELAELLTEWEEQRKIVLDRKNICFIKQDNQNTFEFCYQPPNGNFPAMKEFLWYRNNIWYETTNWQRINHENAIITAKRSHFIHNYSDFFLQGANGIIHHSPNFGNKDEICMCPSFLESTEFIEFESDWQPAYRLWKLKNFFARPWQTELCNKPYGQLKSYPVFHTLDLEPANVMETQGFYPTTYFLLPDWYKNGHMTSWEPFDLKFKSVNNTLEEWIKNAKIERMDHDGKGGEYEHLLKHVHVNYLWNDKKIHESTLDDMDWNNFKVVVRANPAGIMYKFKSQKVLFRYSEDLNFTLEADKMKDLALRMGAEVLDGLAKLTSGGTVDPKTSKKVDDLKDTTNKYLHSGKDGKSKDERQGERKKTLAAGSVAIAQAVMGAVPSLLDASHTHGNYSLGEIALRFNSINFKIRLELNKNLNERYQKMKGLKKNGNQPFNTEKFGNILSRGYWKIAPNIYEGDKDGFFASIFSKGVYVYEDHPNEYFLKKLETGKIKRGLLNDDPVMINTTIQTNYKSAIGRDDQVNVDGLSWVWKDSYCRGAGKDLFPGLIEQGREKIKKDEGETSKPVYYKFQITSQSVKQMDFNTKKYHSKEEWDKIISDPQKGKNLKGSEIDSSKVEYVTEGNAKTGYVSQYINKVTKKPSTADDYLYYSYDLKDTVITNYYTNQQSNISEIEYNSLPHSYSGLKVGDWWAHYYMTGAGTWKFDGYAQWSGVAKLEPNVQYEWYMHAFSNGQKNNATFKGLDDGVEVILRQDGADWELAFKGRVEITETIGNPDAIGSGVEIDDIEEILPEMEDKQQTEGLDNLAQSMEPQAEEQNKNDKEIQEENEQQSEPEQQKQNEKQEELEQEDEKSKDKQNQKQKQRQDEKQEEDEQQDQPENSRQNEK